MSYGLIVRESGGAESLDLTLTDAGLKSGGSGRENEREEREGEVHLKVKQTKIGGKRLSEGEILRDKVN